MQQLITACAHFDGDGAPHSARADIEAVCAYLEAHYAERITLETLGRIAGLNKYTLLRTFSRQKGITPYRYLETVRIGRAKALLEQDISPADIAQQTGFSDQSHFTTYFNKLIGLTPGQYQAIFREEAE